MLISLLMYINTIYDEDLCMRDDAVDVEKHTKNIIALIEAMQEKYDNT